MKPSNPGRSGHPHRDRPSPSVDPQNLSTPSTKTRVGQDDPAAENKGIRVPALSSTRLFHPQVSNLKPRDATQLEVMRRNMGIAMTKVQQKKATHSSSSAETFKPDENLDPDVSLSQIESSSDESVNTAALSTDSARTIKASFDLTPGAVRTPSYPFPRMNFHLNRGLSHRSGPSHKPFTLLSPTNEPVGTHSTLPASQHDSQNTSSETTTPVGQTPISQVYPEDPNFPAPDIYDLILMLNAEPGLDMWWANVTEILSEAYGAERVSLAIPGDMTDLENVPWGQRATFNIYGSEPSNPSHLDSMTNSESDVRSPGGLAEVARPGLDSFNSRRPPLVTRHSIAGPVPDDVARSLRQRPPGPIRASSTISGQTEEQPVTSPVLPRLTRQTPTPRALSEESQPPPSDYPYNTSGSSSSALRCHVHRSIQPLEAEKDPLLVRTGVVSLFGKRKPVVLTRAYTEQAPRLSGRSAPSTPSELSDSRGSLRQDDQQRSFKPFDEFEQPEPSPWSQSPSPSPAARPDPAESPFFVQPSASIDETAFEQNPPPYDYASTANQSLGAIGADMSKTLIHIPLIQPLLARGTMASSLRFPIAILSCLSPLNPYPRSLRHSLEGLLPHLASSFSLAQQYTNLQERARGGPGARHGAAFGLGGTFSDEGSELELMAELSGQVAQDKEKSRDYSISPGVFKESPSSSAASTPLLEHFGFTHGRSPTPGRMPSDMVDSYFTARRQRAGQHPVTPGQRSAKEDSEAPKRQTEKAGSVPKSTRKTPVRQQGEVQSPPPGRANSTSESEFGDRSWASAYGRLGSISDKDPSHRGSVTRDYGEKPLPELISSLMLNAVPLQLFLAKPGTGDLAWTNRKFDAFRSQGEGRVRDPWKNVHSADRNGLVKMWNEALKTGSQFTHYIRVKRFNSDSDFRWFVFRASTLLSNNGELLYWIGSFLDVHEQYMKNLEASEREATMARDNKIRALADAIPQIIFEAVEGDGIVAVNQQWHSFSGQTLAEARGLGFAKHVHRDDLHKCGILSPTEVAAITRSLSPRTDGLGEADKTPAPPMPIHKNLFAPDQLSLDRMIAQDSVAVEEDENGRLSYLTEIRLRSKGSEYRWFLVRLVRVETGMLESSGRASWYGTCTDIETRKRLEEELNEANSKVHSEMESKTKFFANMSHEIRTPLNGILGSMPWLVDSALDHEQRRTVDTIQNSANNLRELVDNILDVTKVEAGKMTLVPKWFQVRTLCEEVIDTVSSRAIERGLELNYTLEQHVPTTVKGDPFRLRQVLLNLLGNSVKFTEQGEVLMRCFVRDDVPQSSSTPTTPDSILLAFEVLDTGRGFNQSDFERLFKQFGQIGGGSNHDAGSGLGLFLSKQLVEMHDGELTVDSKPGEGSSFKFYIRVETHPPGTEVSSPHVTARPGSARTNSGTLGSPRSKSDYRPSTIMSPRNPSLVEGIIQTPGLSKYVISPDQGSPALSPPPLNRSPFVSPPILTSESSGESARSNSVVAVGRSSVSSLIPTPESAASRGSITAVSERQAITESSFASTPVIRRSKSENSSNDTITPDKAHPQTYQIIVICPAEHARDAIAQHIQQVVPYQIAVNVSVLATIGEFLDLINTPNPPTFTHIVLDVPASSDVMLFMRHLQQYQASIVPALVVVTDHYQKRDILEDFTALTASGRKAFMIHKPVKPSVFALIFDPAQLRNLSKDRAREVAQSSSDDFRQIAQLVKDSIGDRGHRILLVEDSEVNRMVIQRYLKKVALDNDSAKNGQECVDMVQKNPPGYYSLIICDIQMPIKNGNEACMELRAWELEHGYQPAPIMALTANAMPEERAAAANAGFTDYLTKPVDFNVLGNMMMTLLDSRIPHVFLRDRPLEA
ncbi:hypothetical protein PV10_02672 [Exophiala mesophila]|uniref:histidine kinase n=1 Tax=Exophiala mesophila TaxID=212818 RepID=A0A0D2A7K4_EXOME|nr:uncharacterized protein PV10_02672 [Exophiala mesophila]KIV94958.1 hypothetical protein PV10_02672 [Exophiala mesophila]